MHIISQGHVWRFNQPAWQRLLAQLADGLPIPVEKHLKQHGGVSLGAFRREKYPEAIHLTDWNAEKACEFLVALRGQRTQREARNRARRAELRARPPPTPAEYEAHRQGPPCRIPDDCQLCRSE